MPKTEVKKIDMEAIDLLPAVIGEVQPEDLAENRGGYERWMSRYGGYEVIFRHQRRGNDPTTGDVTFLGGRRIKFVKGIAYLPKDDPDFKRMKTVLGRCTDVKAGNTFCIDDKIKEGKIEREDDINQSDINQSENIPLLRMGIPESMVPKIQKVLDRRRRVRDAGANKRLGELETEVKRLKAEARAKAAEKDKDQQVPAEDAPPSDPDSGSAEGVNAGDAEL